MLDTAVLPNALDPASDVLDPAVTGIGHAIAGRRRAARASATRRVAVQLRKAEDSLDQAGIELAHTLIVSLEARMDAGISATFAHDLVAAQTKVLADWSRSRGNTIEWHKRALRYAGVLGTKIVAEGDTDRPDDMA